MKSDEELHRAFSYYPRLKKVKEFVEQHLAEPVELKDAARVASLEPKYFSRFFKEKTGVSFSRWLHDQRIARAMELLESEEISITTLVGAVGYSSERTFLRAFKERLGMLPSDYRKSIQNRLHHS